MLFEINGRQVHAVEGIVFHHGIDSHITEHHAASGTQGLVKAVIPDHVSRQTGRAAQAVIIGLFPQSASPGDWGPVGHFQHIRHMAGGRGI